MPTSISQDKVRDHLANERTHLAWVRTSIALLGFGVVVARLTFGFGGSQTEAANSIPLVGHGGRALLLGLLFCGVGIITLGISAVSYTRNRDAIDNGRFIPAGAGLMILTSVIAALGVASVLYLLRL